MMINNIEKKILLGIYVICLIAGVWLFGSAGMIYYNHGGSLGLEAFVFLHSIFCLALPLIGLWCLYKKYDWGYICVGILLVYIYMQARLILFGY